MNSLKSLLSQLGGDLGVELVAVDKGLNESELFEIQLVGHNSRKTFSFVLSRSWKTTQIRFVPGPFAGQFVKYLCDQILVNYEKIASQVQLYETSFSDLRLEIDGLKISSGLQELTENPILSFEVDILTSQSSLNLGLVNEKEAKLIVFAISLMISVLPISESVFRNPDEVVGFPEGAVAQVMVNRYERDPRNRRLAIDLHGHSCQVCDFNFAEMYGEIGSDYIVVHHVFPLSALGEEYVIDPLTDLVTVCANCHAMLHAEDPPISISDLRKRLRLLGERT